MHEKIITVGKRIRILRLEKDVSQTELAEKIGVTQTNMSNIENGRTAVTLANLFKIQEVLHCRMNDFFIDFDNETKVKKEFALEELQEAAKLLQMLRTTKSE